MELPPLLVRILGDASQLSATLAASNAEIEGYAGKTKGLMGSMGLTWEAAGAIVLAASVKMASDFQASMLRIQTQAGATSGEVKKMSDFILNLAPTVGESPKKLADALFYVESAGLRGKAAMDALKYGAELARIGNSNLTDTVSGLATLLASGYVSGANAAHDATAQMNAIVGVGKMTMQDFDNALKTGIVGTAKNFGVSLESLGAGLDVLTINGVPAEMAATRLRMAITLMGAPTQMAAKILGTLGLSQQDATTTANTYWKELEKAGVHITRLADDMRQPDGLFVALKDMKTQMTSAGLTADQQAAVISRAFGGARMGDAIRILINNMELIPQEYAKIQKGTSQFEQDWKRVSDTTKQRFADIAASLQTIMTRIGLAVLPAVSAVAGAFADVFKWVSKSQVVVDALAALIGGALLIKVGQVAIAIASWAVSETIGFFETVALKVMYIWDGIVQIASAISELSFSGLIATIAPLAATLAAAFGPFLIAAGYFIYETSFAAQNTKKWDDAARDLAHTLESGVGGSYGHQVHELNVDIANLKDQHKHLADQLSKGQLTWRDENDKVQVVDRAIKDLQGHIKEMQKAKENADKVVGNVGPQEQWLKSLVTNAAATETDTKKLGELSAKAQQARNDLSDAYSKMGLDGDVLANMIATQVGGDAKSLQDLTKAVGKVEDAYGGIGPKADEAAKQIVAAGQTDVTAIADVAKAAQKFRDSVTQSFEQATSVTKAFGQGFDPAKGDPAKQIMDFFTNSEKAAEKWAKDMGTLADKGLRGGIYAELAQAGPASLPLTDAFANMSKESIDKLNGIYDKTHDTLQGVLDTGMSYMTPYFDVGANLGAHYTNGVGSGMQSAVDNARNIAIQAAQAAQDASIFFQAAGVSAINAYNAGIASGLSATDALFNAQHHITAGDYGPAGGNRNIPTGGAAVRAEGGYITAPELALIGEAGPELVLPLSNPTRMADLLASAGLIKPFGQPASVFSPISSGGDNISATFVMQGNNANARAFAEDVYKELVRLKRNRRNLSLS